MCLHNHETLTERLTVSDSRQGPQKGPVPGHGEHEDPVEGTEGALAETRTIALLDQQEEKPLGRPSGLNPVPGQTAPDHGQTVPDRVQTAPDHGQTAPDRVQTAPDQVQTDQKEKPLGRPSGLNPLGDIKTATQQAEGKGLRPWMHVLFKKIIHIYVYNNNNSIQKKQKNKSPIKCITAPLYRQSMYVKHLMAPNLSSMWTWVGPIRCLRSILCLGPGEFIKSM